MHTFIRSPQRVRGLLLLGICVLLLGSLPSHITLAASKQQEINNALVDLKDGKFQRTSLSNSVRPIAAGDKVKDQVGGVRLGPIGLLKQWFQSPFRLPKALYRMGATTVGSRMFLIGGSTPNSISSDRVADVWSTAVSQLDGSLIAPGWVAEPSLPAVQGADQTFNPNLSAPVAEVDSPAVTSVVDSSGQNGYIYVIGGHTAAGLYDFSSYAVRIGTVANGRITGWQDQVGARFPSLDPSNQFIKSHGVHSATALSHSIGGVTYVYLVGGLQHYYSGSNAQDDPLNTVFYAKVGAGGKLFNPTSGAEGWALLPQRLNVPIGLWDATGTIDNYVASNQTSADALYIIGGQLSSSPAATFSNAVYRAIINPDGTLIWDWSGTLPEARNGATAIPFRGNIYLTGGQPNGVSPDAAVLTSYVNDDLTLFEFSDGQGNGSNFLKSDAALLEKRSLHGSVLVTADATSPNSAFLYVLGGFGTEGGDVANKPRDTVIYGKVGGGEDISSSGYAPTGWYYSKPFNVAQQFSEVTVQEIDWTTTITRTTSDMDIAMEYRLSSSNDCATATWADWIPLTGATDGHQSIDGQNIATITDTVARCFQYRAFLTTVDKFATPTLLNVSIKIIIPGSPDLSVKTISDRRGANNSFTGLNVIIQNVNQLAPPTLSADVESPGSFYVDMCIFGPGVTATPPTLPMSPTNKQCSTVYANIDKSAVGPDTTYSVTNWYDTSTDKLANLRDYFQTPGTYTVIVAVDSFVSDPAASPKGFVDEGDLDKGESNNVSAPFSFAVQSTGYSIFLSQMRH
ncbi:MAG: hypothetical protein ABIV47_01510 [Roseiflexaceae bacterium]